MMVMILLLLCSTVMASDFDGTEPIMIDIPCPVVSPPNIPADGRTTTPSTCIVNQGHIEHELRVSKCTRLWQTFAPWSYSADLVKFFISEHERRGIADQWYYSMIYGMANFGLRIGAIAPGDCYGPMDVKWPYCARSDAAYVIKGPWGRSALKDPYVNIACHAGEAARTGRRGMYMLRTVFYPAAPYGRACNAWAPQWDKWDRKFSACIDRGYSVGKLP
jgi:hypothetical protein